MSALSNVKTILSKVMTSFVSENGKIASYYIKASKKKIQKNTILYEVRDGQSIVDSPYAMFMHLVKDPEYAHFHHIWVINDLNYPTVKRIKAEFDNVEFVERNSKRYLLWLATAEYLINNATFQSFFLKREGQTYINTWHGTPLKYMGFDIPGNPAHSQNVVRNFLMADYILSPNSHTTEIFSKSYRLDGLFPGTILEGGYPRIDRTNKTERLNTQKEFDLLGLDYNDQLPTILYTPTWKGASILNPSNDKQQIINETIFLKQYFQGRYNVLVKVHPYVYKSLSKNDQIRTILVPDYFDPNEVLSVVDLLITDYSSIFFDYLVTDKPVIFYVWDRDLYEVNRGMYIKERDLPGPVAETIEDLIDLIENKETFITESYERYVAMKNSINYYQDGQVTQRYIERIFHNVASTKIKEISLRTQLKKIVIYPGGMRNNGITTSFINLSNTIDHQQYDVSIILNKPISDEEVKNLKKINHNVRMLFRPGKPLYTRGELLRDVFFQMFTVKKFLRTILPSKAYEREAARAVGNVYFDVAIDFSGYSFFWSKLIAFMKCRKKIIFQHNDLLSDSKKIINGKAPHKKNLPAVFSIYYLFDRILSVSKETMEVNKVNLSKYIQDDQIGYTTNTIDIEKILTNKSPSFNFSDGEDIKIYDYRFSGKIIKSGNYKLAKNLSAVVKKTFSSMNITEDDNLYVIASAFYDNHEYVKVTINGIYRGWMQKKYIYVVNETETSSNELVERCSLIATVNCINDDLIYHSLDDFEKARSPLRYLNNTYVYLSKTKKINDYDYYYIENRLGAIGWVKTDYLSNFHRIFHFGLLKKYFLNKISERKSLVLDNFESISILGKFKKDISVAWSEPEQILGSEPVFVDFKKNDKLLFIKKGAMNNVEYYCSNVMDGKLLWFKADNVVEITTETKQKPPIDFEIKKDLIQNLRLPEIKNECINLVNMGRLSPEKNQLNLIKAIGMLINKYPKLCLYILGEGPLKLEMQQLIQELDLKHNVFLLGHQDNPFDIMKQCDFFVFPSIYEGQPMVLLEALTLKLPVLASEIPANISVLKGQSSQYIKGFTPMEIAEAIQKCLETNKKEVSFDPYAYNERAIRNLYLELE
ncbi:CDP-glycerol glycerophosphotransferase family protein [Enterococcus casseliflavus]|uniref:CDP-glycerol glycerophosphotransferase family protein n=1 Tax=Enterococcus casseliflavus TaxID=37734 RepID=UPI000DFED598|nr:CDP-glycerol glycerophosphotransferase family protein [Enterococcus casseliflavus]GEB27878.1 hypothetical protein ECA02_09730 [Enterococcus casseliflavus]STP35972.1 Putative glycosyl/glycerophosphate transferases involved in teichoic acid biosynthesis TagF/TagB/EpsJ/RodC [Enterococcus casseliflavus]